MPGRVYHEGSASSTRLPQRQELDFEHERRVGRDDGRKTPSAVGEYGRDGELA